MPSIRLSDNGKNNKRNNRENNKSKIRRLVPLGIISAIFLNPLAVLVNREGSLLLKA